MSNMRINSTNIPVTSSQPTESAETSQQPASPNNDAEPQPIEQKLTQPEIGRQTFEAFIGGSIRSAELNAELSAVPTTQANAEVPQQGLILPGASEVEQNGYIRSNEALQPGDPSLESEPPQLPDPLNPEYNPLTGPSAWPPPDWKPGKTY